MADNIVAPATGTTFLTDELAGGVHAPVTKVAFGGNGTATPVADASGERLPVKVAEALPAGSNAIGTVELGATSLAALESVNAAVTGTVELGATSLAALETVTATVSGTVELGSTTLAALENVNAAVTGTVELGATSLAALETVNAAVTGTIELGATSLAALESVNSSVTSVPVTSTTTREYAAGYRAAVVTAATTFALSGNLTLGASREVRIRASVACWIRFATAGTGQDAAVPGTNAAAPSIPFDANASEVVRVPAGCTHISVIRDTTDGAVTFIPVA
jgi:hypothetical protein